MTSAASILTYRRGLLTGIVTRLRVVLAVVALVMLLGGLAIHQQTRAILASHEQLTQASVPTLLLTQRTVRNLNALFVTLERINSVTSTADLKEVRRAFRSQSQPLEADIAALSDMAETRDVATSLANFIRRMEADISRLFDYRLSLFSTQNAVARRFEDMEEIRKQSRAMLQAMSFDTTTQIEAMLNQARATGQIELNSIDQLFSELFLASLNLANLSLDIEALIDIARNQNNRTAQWSFKDSRAALEERLRRIVQLLAQISGGADRKALAVLIARLRETTLGSDGLIARSEAQQRYEGDLATIRQAHMDMVSEISVLVGQLTKVALRDVDAASLRLSQNTRTLDKVTAIVCGIVALTLLLANWKIIERQINLRMRRIDRAVRAIADGKLEHVIDVHGRDELGDIARALEIFKKTAYDLQKSNQELERFAYAAAHDLRSPLRAILDLAIWTLEDEQTRLSEQSRDYMTLLEGRVTRLNNLLTDLLNYAQAGADEQEMTVVDLRKVVQQIAEMLDYEDNYKIRYEGPDQPLRMHAVPLTQILMNLLSNAINHHDQPSGQIMVSASQQGDRVIIRVADDGPGIPSEYSEKVFALFQTLRPRDEVEGSGLGLALIRKLVDRYHGEVRLISDPETRRGATFEFDFPAAPAITMPHPPSAIAAQ